MDLVHLKFVRYRRRTHLLTQNWIWNVKKQDGNWINQLDWFRDFRFLSDFLIWLLPIFQVSGLNAHNHSRIEVFLMHTNYDCRHMINNGPIDDQIHI